MEQNLTAEQTNPPTTRVRKRLRHHLWLAIGTFALTAAIYGVLMLVYPSPRLWIFRWSLATAYVASALLAYTLTLGAWNLRCGKITPISSDLRRDFGIWCGIWAIAHTFIGLNVHQKDWRHYFFDDGGAWRTDLFGFVNYVGVAAVVIVVLLLLTSNDFALKKLKSQRWKTVHRLNYVFAFLVALHGILFIVVEKRIVPFLFIFAAFVVWILIFQGIGFQTRRKQNAKDTKMESKGETVSVS